MQWRGYGVYELERRPRAKQAEGGVWELLSAFSFFVCGLTGWNFLTKLVHRKKANTPQSWKSSTRTPPPSLPPMRSRSALQNCSAQAYGVGGGGGVAHGSVDGL